MFPDTLSQLPELPRTDTLPSSASWDTLDTPAPSAARYPALIPYRPGQSGNPAGRTAMADYILTHTHGGREIIDAVLQVLRSYPQYPKVRLQAAELLLDRAFGKAVESLTVTGAGGGPVQVETRALAAMDTETLRALVRQREELLQYIRDGKVTVTGSSG